MKVLVVEDDEDMCAAMRDSLEMAGFLVMTSNDGREAHRRVEQDDIEVVVSDIRLPGMSGIELARNAALRADPPKVVLITAFPDAETVKDAHASGAAHFMAKPLGLRDLAHVVQRLALGEGLGFISRETLLRLR